MSGPEVQHEVERKFRVDEDFVVPELLEALPNGFTATPLPTRILDAEYYDTEDLRLLCWGITLRRRSGGDDEGWHLKLPSSDEDGRHEIRMPLSAGLPPELGDAIASITRGDDLELVAKIHTERKPTQISNSEPVMEFVDDRVTIETADRPMLNAGTMTFRELELELADPAYEKHWNQLARMLEKHGAKPSSVKKIAAAIGSHVALHPEFVIPEYLTAKSTLQEAFLAYFNAHAEGLVYADIGVRLGFADSVHQMRVNARRLRSALKLAEPYLDAEWAENLEAELRWIASELGAARDVEVQLERLSEHAHALPNDLAQLVDELLTDQLEYRTHSAHGAVLAAVRSDRYQYLIEDLIEAAHGPHFMTNGEKKARKALAEPLNTQWDRLAKAFAKIEMDSPSEDWHNLRIAAKRARYAIDVFGSVAEMAQLADRMSMLTDVLGSHQDAHVSQMLLRELAETGDGLTGFGLGVLHGIERDFELLDRIRAINVWKDVRKAAAKTEVLGG